MGELSPKRSPPLAGPDVSGPAPTLDCELLRHVVVTYRRGSYCRKHESIPCGFLGVNPHEYAGHQAFVSANCTRRAYAADPKPSVNLCVTIHDCLSALRV